MIPGNQTLRVKTATPAGQNLDGNVTFDYAITATVSGFLHLKTGNELVGGLYVTVTKWQAFIPLGTAVTHEDTVLDAAGNEYRVDTVLPHLGYPGVVDGHLELLLTKAP